MSHTLPFLRARWPFLTSSYRIEPPAAPRRGCACGNRRWGGDNVVVWVLIHAWTRALIGGGRSGPCRLLRAVQRLRLWALASRASIPLGCSLRLLPLSLPFRIIPLHPLPLFLPPLALLISIPTLLLRPPLAHPDECTVRSPSVLRTARRLMAPANHLHE
ncbi:hypothetical protein DFH08DRAFT_1050215 [Mycena albidolilacea]|uniref:Uncharacterized protein n=1 Tax=Mycena albidolilacea TaxID=1033008 RepID=A0AAD6Z601_9AGAR|nr:hypothetical protein DFH08DRAFT_1050215 [Mycena albidolilacea]